MYRNNANCINDGLGTGGALLLSVKKGPVRLQSGVRSGLMGWLRPQSRRARAQEVANGFELEVWNLYRQHPTITNSNHHSRSPSTSPAQFPQRASTSTSAHTTTMSQLLSCCLSLAAKLCSVPRRTPSDKLIAAFTAVPAC